MQPFSDVAATERLGRTRIERLYPVARGAFTREVEVVGTRVDLVGIGACAEPVVALRFARHDDLEPTVAARLDVVVVEMTIEPLLITGTADAAVHGE